MFSIHLDKPGFFSIDTTIALSVVSDTVLTFALSEAALVNIDVTPPQAQVQINDSLLTSDSVQLHPGEYTFFVQAPGYRAERRRQIFLAGQNTVLQFRLEKQNGKPAETTASGVEISSTPGEAAVFINDRLAGYTPLFANGLEPGRHRIRIERDGFKPYLRTIRLTGGETTVFAASLEPLSGILNIIQTRRVH
jgi:hypothetical protein